MSTYYVCQICFHESDHLDLLSITCRYPYHHGNSPRVLVAEDRGILVAVRPLPLHFRPSGWFIKCYDGMECERKDKCTFAHSNAEKRVWNHWLKLERANPPPSAASITPALELPSQVGVRRSVSSHYERRQTPPLSDMELPVTLENYRRKFLALIYYEEQEHAQLLHSKCDGQYRLIPCESRDFIKRPKEEFDNYAYLEGMTSQQIMYAAQASDNHVYLRVGQVSIDADILSCNYRETTNERLYIGYNTSPHQKFTPSRGGFIAVDAKFRINRQYFNDLTKGVLRISTNILKRLLPEFLADCSYFIAEYASPRRTLYRRVLDIDCEQYQALDIILSYQCSLPILIPGSFGCGKTRILAVATECFYRHSKERGVPCRVLISCHHQHSADVFMDSYFNEMLQDKKHPWPVEVVRVTSTRIHVSHTQSSNRMSSHEFRDSFSIFKDKKYIVVVTTFGGALRISEVVQCDYFTHILIDEGAQTREPEALSPFLMANANTRIVIAGDHKQVGPQLVVLGEGPQNHGLCVSLMERLLLKYQSIGPDAMKLAPSWNVNYRSQADILELPSTLFYERRLVSCGRVPYHLKAPYPFVFICSGFHNKISPCTYCELEARMIVEAVHQYSDHFKSWEMKDTCIMTPSLRQANIIRNLIYKEHSSLQGVNIITSYQMQGQEYRMLFMSTVESLESTGEPYDVLKSFCHPALFNTAITRSKSLVVAVGNPLVLLMSESTMDCPKWCWSEFIKRCLKYGAFQIAPNDNSKFREIEGQLNDMLSCRDAQEMMKLFRKKSYPVIPVVKLPPASSTSQSLESKSTSDSTAIATPTSKGSKKRRKRKASSQGATPNASSPRQISKQSSTLEPQAAPITTPSLPQQSTPKVTPNQPSQPKTETRSTPNMASQKKPAAKSQLPTLTTPQVIPTVAQKQPSVINATQKPSSIAKKQTSQSKPAISQSAIMSKSQPSLQTQPSSTVSRQQLTSALRQSSSNQRGHFQDDSFLNHVHQTVNEELLCSHLTRDNYRTKFHQLLCREEDEHSKILKEKCDGVYTLGVASADDIRDAKDYHVFFANITAEHLDEDAKAYAIQASEGKVLVFFPSGTVKADILKGYNNLEASLYLGFNRHPHLTAPPIQVHIKFVLKYSYFHRLHKAIDSVSDVTINRLVPNNSHEFTVCNNEPINMSRPSRRLRNIIDLDFSQARALETIMSCQSNKAPVLVIGSFGTGKTRLLARTAYQLITVSNTNRVLICAHHQHSADSFIINYFAKMKRNGGWYKKIFRLVPNPDYKITPGYEEFYVTSKHKSFLSSKYRVKIRAVVTTFSTSLHLLDKVPVGFFTHILLDEGAQSREPESIAPLCLADKNTQIIIAGDHKQVGPSLLVLGEAAINHGLSTSLLERLHERYEKLVGDTHRATLLTNFRCHHALLALPSYLFYDSALITAADTATHLHPKTKYPLHFICSSLSQEREVKASTNEFEITLLLQQVLKYVKDWPTKEWGFKDLSKICIMTTTASQKKSLIKEIKTKPKYSCLRTRSQNDGRMFTEILIGILTVYDIQGNEFEAIFLSTAEPTTVEGKSKNPTKTPCSQYVFNTALTRAKSLVVCAGNPFLLMTVEKHMGNESQCWKDYIRRCIISKTITVHPNPSESTTSYSIDESIKTLQGKIFNSATSGDITAMIAPPTKDSILRSFKNMLHELPRYKYCKLAIREEQSESVWDIVEEQDTQDKPSDDEYDDNDIISTSEGPTIKCELEIKDQRLAIATPLQSSSKFDFIHINGFNNRKGAFNGDIVEIQLFPHKEPNQDREYGRVVNVIEPQHPTRYVCRSDLYGIINFYPLDKTAPCIINLPKISLNLLKNFHDKIDKSSLQDYITVFKEETLSTDKDEFPQIKELIPFEVSHSLLFVVQVLGWNPKYRKALGAVVEAVPRTSNLFFTTHLLKLAYDIKENKEDMMLPLLPVRELQCTDYNRAFTIDPPGSVDLDDAISLVPIPGGKNTYELAVFISNVARHVPPDSELSKRAEAKGTSVYGAKNGTGSEVIHMLPEKLVSNRLSLDCKVKRDALCVSGVVATNEEGQVISVVFSGAPKQATVTSQVRLTYQSAKQILNNELVVDNGELITSFNKGSLLCMKDTLQLLYKIAMKLRIDRLGNAAYCYVVSEPGEEEYWETHLLIEELMIWTNAAIAQYLHDKLPQMTLLRHQQSPLRDDMTKFTSPNQSHLSYSLSLSQHYTQQEREQETVPPLLVPSSTLEHIRDACTTGNIQKLIWLLSDDKFYPQLAIALGTLHSISRQAKYSVIEKEHSCPDHAHHSLSLEAYTHFTSPIRRYFDLLVQRLVIALIEKADISYTVEELKRVCSHLNIKTKLAKEFERKHNKALLTNECKTSSIKTEAFVIVSQKRQNQFELCFYSNRFHYVQGQDTCFKSSHLNSHHSSANGNTVWHVVSMSLKPVNRFLTHPDIWQASQGQSSHCTIYATIYHYKTRESEEGGEDQEQCLVKSILKLATKTKVEEVSCNVWKLTHAFLKSPTRENLEKIKIHFTSLDESTQNHHPLSSTNDAVTIYDVKRPFKCGEVINVWLTKSLKESLPTPSIQLIEIAPTVRVCLQHNQNPAFCFSNVQLQGASREHYHSLEEYVDLWSQVLVAEAANEGVNTKNLMFIRDANLQWPELERIDNCVDDVYYRPKEHLVLMIPSEKRDSLDFIQIKSGDFICARYEVMKEAGLVLNAVYHFVVIKKIDPNDSEEFQGSDDVIIHMIAEGDQSCRITQDMAQLIRTNKGLVCDVQVIPMPDSFNRVYTRLKKATATEGSFFWSKLGQSIATGNGPLHSKTDSKEFDASMSIFKSDPLSYQVWKSDSSSPPQLNRVQVDSIKKAIRNRFQLIQGPPGTGKSVTGAHLAYIFSRANNKLAEQTEYSVKQCVVYCGPSNKSVDVVHEKLRHLNHTHLKGQLKILRVYGRTHERKVYPDPCHNLLSEYTTGDEEGSDEGKGRGDQEEAFQIREGTGRCLEEFHEDALHFKIRRAFPRIVEKEKALFSLLEQNIIPTLSDRKDYKDSIIVAERDELMNNYDIILCTCNETCSPRMLTLSEKGRIAQCIVDECGMAHEPETIAAASLCEHVVLIGDHKQLQPVIKYPQARECGLGVSLFERYANIWEKEASGQLITLEIQYRMHHFICKGPSDCFYESKLRADISVTGRHPLNRSLRSLWPKGHNFPLLFHNVYDGEETLTDSKHSQDVDSHSKCNKNEANVVLSYVTKLVNDFGLRYTDIAILTPYAAQKRLICDKIREHRTLSNWTNPKVATIAESQGDEYNIVILTTVRCQRLSEIKHRNFVQPDRKWMRENLGFLTDEHQVNVGITRAKYGLIIVGNVTLLKYDDTWRSLINLYRKNGCIIKL